MKINIKDKPAPARVPFDEIKTGELFKTTGGDIFLKTINVNAWNAFEITEGTPHSFHPMDMVTPLNYNLEVWE
jgi:hypothetical protein